MESRYGQTSFRDYSHAQLVAMLQAGRVPDVGAAGGGWREIANGLDGMALTLEQRNVMVAQLWDGPAAQAHEAMIASLVDGARQVAWTARRLGDQVVAAAEALRRAQERMASLPAPVDVRPPDEAVLAAAATRGRNEAWADAAARQAQAMRVIQEFRRAQAAAATVTAAAVQIMEELRDAYRNVDFPRPPTVEEPPTIGPDGAPVFAAPATLAANGRPQLLANLWRNGLISTAGMPPVEVLPAYAPASEAPAPVGTAVGGSSPAPPAVQALPPPNLGDFAAPATGVRLPPLPPLGGGGDDLGAPEPLRAVGTASVATGLSAAGGAVPAGVPPAGTGLPLVPPMMGGFMPPMTGGAGELGRADRPWLISKVEYFDQEIQFVPDSVES